MTEEIWTDEEVLIIARGAFMEGAKRGETLPDGDFQSDWDNSQIFKALEHRANQAQV